MIYMIYNLYIDVCVCMYIYHTSGSNAFILVSRQAFIRIVRDKFPHLAHWVEFCYAGQPFLWWDKHVLRSAAGVQQGDPLGPILFSLVLQEVVREVVKQLPDLDLNVWYLDDDTITGKSADVAQALQIIEVEGRKLGLELRKDKCKLFWPTENPDLVVQRSASEADLPAPLPFMHVLVDGEPEEPIFAADLVRLTANPCYSTVSSPS